MSMKLCLARSRAARRDGLCFIKVRHFPPSLICGTLVYRICAVVLDTASVRVMAPPHRAHLVSIGTRNARMRRIVAKIAIPAALRETRKPNPKPREILTKDKLEYYNLSLASRLYQQLAAHGLYKEAQPFTCACKPLEVV